jgi:hypothetical protein
MKHNQAFMNELIREINDLKTINKALRGKLGRMREYEPEVYDHWDMKRKIIDLTFKRKYEN